MANAFSYVTTEGAVIHTVGRLATRQSLGRSNRGQQTPAAATAISAAKTAARALNGTAGPHRTSHQLLGRTLLLAAVQNLNGL